MKYLRYICLVIFLSLGSCIVDTVLDSIDENEYSSRIDKTYDVYNDTYDSNITILVPSYHIPVLKNMYHLSDSADINTIAHHNGIEDTFYIAQNDTIMIGESWWNVIYENSYKIQYNCLKDISLDLMHDSVKLVHLDLYNIPIRKNDTTNIKTKLVHEITFNETVEPWHEN